MSNNRYGCIYKTTNIVTKKVYIGQTIYINNVLEKKYKGSGSYLWNSINKYGWEKFNSDILCYCDSKEELNKMEEFYIKELNSLYPLGYNLMTGGSQNGKHHEESRKKMSQPGEKNPFYGKKHSEETLCKLRGRKFSKKHKEGISKSKKGKARKVPAWNKGTKASEDTKKKMSDVRRGVQKPEFTCPHCNKFGRGAHVMIRYHFDNCKQKLS